MSKRGEMKATFQSFEWLLKEKLTSIDNITRAMQQEMTTMGVSRKEAAAYIPDQFKRLMNEVAEQQYIRYDRKGETA